MKILNTEQIRKTDQFTIEHEPISSIELMERAAMACFWWIKKYYENDRRFIIICGSGNNGGDGLAITRLLLYSGYKAIAFVLGDNNKKSDDFAINEKRLRDKFKSSIVKIQSSADLPQLEKNDVVIDAIFGTGLSSPVKGIAADCINAVNSSGAEIVSIDLPSGLFADQFTDPDHVVVQANHTLTFQIPKFSFFFSCNYKFIGKWHVLDIGLNKEFIEQQISINNFFSLAEAQVLLKPRPTFSHKGTFGHALLVSGSKGKIGAAVLAAKACLRSGTGLLTVHAPACGLEILQTAVPEAMVLADENSDFISSNFKSGNYSAIGIGPSLGTKVETWKALDAMLLNFQKPIVLDADALNLLSLHKDSLKNIPANSILTPHPKEFERLTKKVSNDFERHDLQLEFSAKYNVIVVLKGAYSCITTPDGNSWFNSTGNPGMARGGTGDALTGILLGLLAQSYTPLESALLGVFIHGLAGDEAANLKTEYAMTTLDLINSIPKAFKKILIK